MRIFFRNQPISNNNCLCWPCLLTDRDEMGNLYRGPSIAATYQVSVHLAKRFQRRRFFMNRPISNKNCLFRPCLLRDQDYMSNLYREPAIYASYQVRFIWPSGFRGEDFFRNRPITLKRNYGSVFFTQNYELQFSFNVIFTITYSTL